LIHGRAALARGDLVAVEQAAQALARGDPREAEAPFLLAMAEAGRGRLRLAIAHLHAAIALQPKGEYRAQLARCLVQLREDGAAAQVLADAEQALPEDALSRDTMGCVYARLGDHAAALPHFAEAIRLAPAMADYRYNHATTLNFLGQVAQAEQALLDLLERFPDDARSWHLLAHLRKQTAQDNHRADLEAALARAVDPRSLVLLGYGLAKLLDDLGEEQAGFAQLSAANATHRATLDYGFARDEANFDAVEKVWPAIARATVVKAPQEAPVFIIGMPRTGTTLVDRIITSHPAMESAGELQAMPLAVKLASGTRSRLVLDAETMAAMAQADLGAIGADYLRRAAHHRRDPAKRFTDKFPGNFHYAGIIARALPQAKIICLRRHPLDTVLANFRNLFAISSRYYDYSYDVMDIARYYARFDRLMAYWQKALPDRIMELHYEDLVADQEGMTRRLLAHCGLEWDEACLHFHRNAAPVSTPSAAQVRQPIYSAAVARWKRHEAALAPVADYLREQGIAV
jgi:tetratricopeptide (TPR) repeat protein